MFSIRPFDNYDYIARVFPAFLTMLPLIVAALILSPKGLSTSLIAGNLIVIALLFAVMYLLASVARSRGLRIEAKLLAKWGGWPTTILLRHSDTTIDRATKARYHAALAVLSSDLRLPSAEAEKADPAAADLIYRSATRRLIEARKAPEYGVLLSENASYGFRRNMLGILPIAVGVALGSALVTGCVWCVQNHAAFSTLRSLTVAATSSWLLLALVAFDLIWALILLSQITPDFVLQASRGYAEALLKTLDRPATGANP